VEEMAERTADANRITREYFDQLLLEQRLMGTTMPDTSITIFGETFDSPITTAALSHLGTFHPDMESPMEAYARGAYLANVPHFVGMMENKDLDPIMKSGARTIRIVKPYADEEKIYSRLRYAKEKGAFGVGMDIDHSFTRNGTYDICMGEEMNGKSCEKLQEYIQATDLPFVIKGILSVRDAYKAAEIGAKGIVVSHHAGRMDYAVPPLMVLPDIRKEVGADMVIFVDCGVLSGMDAYKALALGATAVSVGKHLVPCIKQGGAQAVADRLKEMNAELRGVMAFTGVKDTNSFDPTVIHHRVG
jgi:isopentenyl diphosphate isomerase/L-lactate dehydrogenase-like FMN-dependent dehydrogenase